MSHPTQDQDLKSAKAQREAAASAKAERTKTLLREGLPPIVVAERLRLSHSYVCRVAKDAGIKIVRMVDWEDS